MTKTASNIIKLIVLSVTVTLLLAVYACKSTQQPTANKAPEVPPSTTTAPPSVFNVKESVVIERKSPFDHNRPEHQTKTKDCGFCHQRADNSVTPVFPGHGACIECHGKDFSNPASQMCIVCHTSPVDAQGTRISFPAKMSEFGLKGFSHRDHMDARKMEGQGVTAACNTCHQFTDGVHSSFPNHQQCYSCHAHQPNEKLGECGVCHAEAKASLKFTKGSLPALSLYNFKHSSHTKAASCDRCHKSVEVGENQVRSDIVEISTARGQRHTSACWSCHNTKREFTCTKCHRGSIPFSF
jgi:hypothetical protein